MNEIVKFKKNIFTKYYKKPIFPKLSLSGKIDKVIKFRDDLIQIKKNFGNYNSREVHLYHIQSLPPKTGRCTSQIISLDKKNSLSKYFYNNFDDDKKIKLIALINIQKKFIR